MQVKAGLKLAPEDQTLKEGLKKAGGLSTSYSYRNQCMPLECYLVLRFRNVTSQTVDVDSPHDSEATQNRVPVGISILKGRTC